MVPSKSVDDEVNGWVSATAQQALGYAYTLVHNQQVAEDLLQDCFRRLLAKADVYDLPADGTKLLYRAITNACINWTQRHPSEISFDQLQQATTTVSQQLFDRSAVEPLQIVLQQELEEAVDAAMQKLPVEQRAAIELRSLGHSLGEVADLLEISPGNARVLLHRARTSLTVHLRPYLEENEG